MGHPVAGVVRVPGTHHQPWYLDKNARFRLKFKQSPMNVMVVQEMADSTVVPITASRSILIFLTAI